MRPIILALIAIRLTGATFTVPNVQQVEMPELVIQAPSREVLCKKYDKLFMDLLHASLTCSEDYMIMPKEEERCMLLRRRLNEVSRLRSIYCYGEDDIEI
jgi:hypothetical protein